MKWKNVSILTNSFLSDCKEFSLSVAFGRFLRDAPLMKWERRRVIYERAVIRYLSRKYDRIFNKYLDQPMFPDRKALNIVEKGNDFNIWVMWWQGLDSMPPIVRACYRQLLKNAGKNKVVLITAVNLGEFVHLPEHVMGKFAAGMISMAHFSDIVRAYLLKHYGGLWIDATVFTRQDFAASLSGDFFTLRHDGLFPNLIFRGKWSVFLLFVKYPGSVISSCLLDVFIAYWNEHRKQIDYLLIDYGISIMEERINCVREALHSAPQTPAFYDLNLNINKPYSECRFLEMMNAAPFHKLNYRKDLSIRDASGMRTYYGFMVENIQ